MIEQQVQHTQQCLERQQADATYLAQWPNHCRDCAGAGILIETFDPSPVGVSLSGGSMTSSEPCSQCTECGKCPRCGHINMVYEEDEEEVFNTIPCTECGFTFANGGRPEVDCYCYEQQQEAQETKYEMLRDWPPFFGDEGDSEGQGNVYIMNRDLYEE